MAELQEAPNPCSTCFNLTIDLHLLDALRRAFDEDKSILGRTATQEPARSLLFLFLLDRVLSISLAEKSRAEGVVKEKESDTSGVGTR